MMQYEEAIPSLPQGDADLGPPPSGGAHLRLAAAGAGVSANLATSYAFYYILYPFVIWKYGLLAGGIILTAVSFTACLAALMAYSRTRDDWFGLDALKKKLRAGAGKGRLRTALARAGGPLAFVLLTIKFDPFVTTAFMRRGPREASLTSRDWAIFAGSVVFANGYWMLVMHAGGSALGHFNR